MAARNLEGPTFRVRLTYVGISREHFLTVFFLVTHDGLSERGTTRSLAGATSLMLITFLQEVMCVILGLLSGLLPHDLNVTNADQCHDRTDNPTHYRLSRLCDPLSDLRIFTRIFSA